MDNKKYGSNALKKSMDSLKRVAVKKVYKKQLDIKAIAPQNKTLEERQELVTRQLMLNDMNEVHNVEKADLARDVNRDAIKRFNAYGAEIGSYRIVNNERRQWITIEQAPLQYYREANPSHYKYCISISKDPDVCVERIIPKVRNDREVTYALKAFKSGKAHNNYTSTRKKTNV